MYECKAFQVSDRTIESLNCLMDRLTEEGWDIMQVDFDMYTVLARKSKTLLD